MYLHESSTAQAQVIVSPAKERMIRVIIERVRALDQIDIVDETDFFATITINANDSPIAGPIINTNDIAPNWAFYSKVTIGSDLIPITIKMMDFNFFSPQIVDISSGTHRELRLDLDIATCTITGDLAGSCAQTLVGSGDDIKRAEVHVRIEVGPVIPITVRTIIERVHALDSFGGVAEGDPDFYAIVRIDNHFLSNRGDNISGDDIFPNWEFSQVVEVSDFAEDKISISLNIYDSDDGLLGEDDHADLSSSSDRTLDLMVDLNLCTISGNTDALSGDVLGSCGTTLIAKGTSLENAEMWFRIIVERPPSTPGLLLRCVHNPIWPQQSDTVSVVAETLDESLNVKKDVDEIEVWFNNRTSPVTICNANSKCSASSSAALSGSDMFYGCLARDGGTEIWSGWRKLAVGTLAIGRAVPVLYTGSPRSRIDIVFIPDEDSYSGPRDPQFLTDVGNAIRSAYYKRGLFLQSQDKFNFWIALDTGIAEGTVDECEILEPPDNWDTSYSFADSGVILHTLPHRDCARRSDRIFSSEPFSHYTLIHETGHSPFGLADEYCCDGGYFEAEPLPNLYNELTDCTDDINDLRNWDQKLGDPQRNTMNCRGVAVNDSWFFVVTAWYASDPPDDDGYMLIDDDLMNDNGPIRGADARRIQWLFDQCRGASC